MYNFRKQTKCDVKTMQAANIFVGSKVHWLHSPHQYLFLHCNIIMIMFLVKMSLPNTIIILLQESYWNTSISSYIYNWCIHFSALKGMWCTYSFGQLNDPDYNVVNSSAKKTNKKRLHELGTTWTHYSTMWWFRLRRAQRLC